MIELPVVRQRGVCCGLPEVDPQWVDSTTDVLKAIADTTRLTMLAALWKAQAPICICDFVGSLELSQPTISHHMGRLKEAGVVESEKRGIWIYYRLNRRMPAQVRNLLTQLLD